eukprot:SAG11_NODE_710_length_7643_cov_26.058177_6_plen_237_part_00
MTNYIPGGIIADITPDELFKNWEEISTMFPMIYGKTSEKRENKKYALKSRLSKKEFTSDMLMYYRALSMFVDQQALNHKETYEEIEGLMEESDMLLAENKKLREALGENEHNYGSIVKTDFADALVHVPTEPVVDTVEVESVEPSSEPIVHCKVLTGKFIDLVEKEKEILVENIRLDNKTYYEFYMSIYKNRNTIAVKKFKKYAKCLLPSKIQELKQKKAYKLGIDVSELDEPNIT